jgi:hypothetical protein
MLAMVPIKYLALEIGYIHTGVSLGLRHEDEKWCHSCVKIEDACASDRVCPAATCLSLLRIHLLQLHFPLYCATDITKVMPKDSGEVVCMHCKTTVSRRTERRHRRLVPVPVTALVSTSAPAPASAPIHVPATSVARRTSIQPHSSSQWTEHP